MPNSLAEARQLTRYFGVPPERIYVTPNGADPRFAEADPTLFVRRFGTRALLCFTGWLGTPVHEAGHLLFCPLFLHRVERVSLFTLDPASGDLGNFSGYAQGSPDYERLINAVHDAAIGAGKKLCGPFNWRDRPDFTCFQNGSETAAISRGAAAELGPLANTQPVPTTGPYARRP